MIIIQQLTTQTHDDGDVVGFQKTTQNVTLC